MTEPYERLQKARRDAGFASASDAARYFGWNENTYRSHENGERGLKTATAARYAQSFRVTWGWLLTGQGAQEDKRSIPVRGHIQAKGKIELITSEQQDWHIKVDFDVPNNSRCYLIATDAMYPRYADGDAIITWEDDDFLAYSKYAEGIAWLDEKRAVFGQVTERVSLSTVEVVGAKPLRNLKIRRLEVANLVVRNTLYDMSWTPRVDALEPPESDEA